MISGWETYAKWHKVDSIMRVVGEVTGGGMVVMVEMIGGGWIR